MKVNEVPQDDANLFEGKTRDVQYAIDQDGKYTTVKSVGWDPKNIVIQQAWEVEKKKISEARKLVEEGMKSPVYYHMKRCLMNVKLLSSYVRLPRYKVRRHFRPKWKLFLHQFYRTEFYFLCSIFRYIYSYLIFAFSYFLSCLMQQ
ncbi:hypothetical protein ES705_17890 [subsurface metagenome]